MMYGVDYSDNHPSATCLHDEGVRFVCRYVGAGGVEKLLDRPEAGVLELAGLQIVSLVEGYANDALLGYAKGQELARLAQQWHAEREFPWPVPCYFAVDFNCTAAQWGAVRDHLHGAASIIGLQWTGVYGSYNVMRWARADDVARWFFQTYAWSGGQWAPGNNIEQYQNGVAACSGVVDLDRAPTNNPGVWNVTTPDTTPSPIDQDLYAIEAAYAAGLDVATRKGSTLNMDLRPYWARVAKDTVDELRDRLASGKILLTATSTVDLSEVNARLDALQTAVESIEPAATVDAVAIAKALAADPGFAQAVGAAIAAQLPVYQGELTLTGPLTLKTVPPAS